MLHESIVLHITNHGKLYNQTLGRCNLLFRTVVDNGKTFKEENLITFKGNLKTEQATIEGTLYFKYIPKFAQMKPVSVIRKAIHTEKGIHDAAPLLPGLPLPKVPILNSETSNVVDDASVKVGSKSGNDLFEEKVAQMKAREKLGSEQAKKLDTSKEIPLPKKEDPPPLISFDSPFTPRNRQTRSATIDVSRQPQGFDRSNFGFAPPANWANFGSNSNVNPLTLASDQSNFQQTTTFVAQNQPFAFGGTPVAMQSPVPSSRKKASNPFSSPQEQTATFNPFI